MLNWVKPSFPVHDFSASTRHGWDVLVVLILVITVTRMCLDRTFTYSSSGFGKPISLYFYIRQIKSFLQTALSFFSCLPLWVDIFS